MNSRYFLSLDIYIFTFQHGPVRAAQGIDNVVMTGCKDGNVRAVQLYSHRFLCVVGHYEGELPIEKMDVSGSGEVDHQHQP